MKNLIRMGFAFVLAAMTPWGPLLGQTAAAPATPRLRVLVLLGEWFGDAYFPLAKEIESRGWTMKRVGLAGEYRGCFNKKRDVVLRSDIVIQDKMDLSGFDALIIPSGPQWRKFNENLAVRAFVQNAHAEGLIVASFCVGNTTVKAAGLVDLPAGPELYPDKVTLVKERVLLGPRGGGPPPGDGFESAPIKEICDAVAREVAASKRPPAPLPIAQGARTCHPCVSPDNKWLFFYRQFQPEQNRPSGFYASARTEAGWSAPIHAGPGRYLTSDDSGRFYTTDPVRGDQPKHCLASMTFSQGRFSRPERLTIQPYFENQTHPCIAPDGSYILFDINVENGSLFVNFKDKDGKWGEAIDLTKHGFKPDSRGADIPPDGTCPFFSVDGDIWRVSSKVIEALRPK